VQIGLKKTHTDLYGIRDRDPLSFFMVPGRFAPNPVRPLSRFAPNPVRPLSRFAPIPVRPGSFRPHLLIVL
jgi:hypothetical protein